MWIVIVFIVFLILLLLKTEMFSASEQEDYDKKIRAQWQAQTDLIESKLKALNLPGSTLPLADFSGFYAFGFYKPIEQGILQRINTDLGPDFIALPSFQNAKSNPDHTIMSYDVTINAIKHFYTRQLRVTVTCEYSPDKSKLNALKVVYMQLVNANEKADNLSVVGFNPKEFQSTVVIENGLGLFYPFHTNEYDDVLPETLVQAAYEEQVKRTAIKQIQQTSISTSAVSNPIFALPTQGQCFSNDGNNIAVVTSNECDQRGGQWSTPAMANQECPFYQANKNYPNFFGGTQSGQCQFPQNVKSWTFKTPLPSEKPLCYNCKSDLIGNGSLGYCCEKQSNKEQYVALASPDYAFDNDAEMRKWHSNDLLSKGMSLT